MSLTDLASCPYCGQAHGGGHRHDPANPSRYELIEDDPRFGLSKGDIVVCESMHWAWADEKVASLYREADHYFPGCSFYRYQVRHVSGPKS